MALRFSEKGTLVQWTAIITEPKVWKAARAQGCSPGSHHNYHNSCAAGREISEHLVSILNSTKLPLPLLHFTQYNPTSWYFNLESSWNEILSAKQLKTHSGINLIVRLFGFHFQYKNFITNTKNQKILYFDINQD